MFRDPRDRAGGAIPTGLGSVAKPWILASPAPLTSHSLRGIPGQRVLGDDCVLGQRGAGLQQREQEDGQYVSQELRAGHGSPFAN